MPTLSLTLLAALLLAACGSENGSEPRLQLSTTTVCHAGVWHDAETNRPTDRACVERCAARNVAYEVPPGAGRAWTPSNARPQRLAPRLTYSDRNAEIELTFDQIRLDADGRYGTSALLSVSISLQAPAFLSGGESLDHISASRYFQRADLAGVTLEQDGKTLKLRARYEQAEYAENSADDADDYCVYDGPFQVELAVELPVPGGDESSDDNGGED